MIQINESVWGLEYKVDEVLDTGFGFRDQKKGGYA